MTALLVVTAVVEIGAGLALLLAPAAVISALLGTTLDTPSGLVVARVAGAALLALGVACGLARDDEQSRAATGLLAGMSLYNAAAAVLLAQAGLGWGLAGIALWPAVFLHAALLVWCSIRLWGRRRQWRST